MILDPILWAGLAQDAVDLVNFPRFANVTWIHGDMGPGDMLFIPHTYWHQAAASGLRAGLPLPCAASPSLKPGFLGVSLVRMMGILRNKDRQAQV